MLEIITHIPLFVWPLFVILLIGGLKARKTSLVSLKVLMVIPTALLGWSLFSFFGRYAADPIAIVLWVLCLGLGCFIGFSHIQRLKLQFDKQKKMVELPGSWLPLVFSMSIFAVKFSIGMMRAMLPHLEGSILFLGLELSSGLILGIFSGRAGGCFLRYKSS
jgi:Family of unknown function (DUF6622)